MKRLVDYKNEEAFELWADLMVPLTAILSDPDIKGLADGKHTYFDIAAAVLKAHKAEAAAIFTRIDPEPLDASNLIGRLLVMLGDIAKDPVIGSFFGLPAQETMDSGSSGSATVNTPDKEK